MADTRYRCLILGDESLTIACANELVERAHEIIAIVSKAGPVKQWAAKHGVPIVNREEIATLDDVDYLLSIANLRVLSREELSIPKHGAINFHDGPVTEIAGVHSPSWAVMRDFVRYGVTWHHMTEDFDCGDIVMAEAFDIEPDETSVSLNTKCFHAGFRSFQRLLDGLESNTLDAKPQSQNDKRLVVSRWQRPECACSLPWSEGAEKINALVRGLDFGPYENDLGLAKLLLPSGLASVKQALVLDDRSTAAPGTVVDVANNWVRVATSSFDLRLSMLNGLSRSPIPILGDRIKLVADCGVQIGDILPSIGKVETAELNERVRRSAQSEDQWLSALAEFPLLDLPTTQEIDEHQAVIELPNRLGEPAQVLAAVATYLGRNYLKDEVGLWLKNADPEKSSAEFFLDHKPFTVDLVWNATYDEFVGSLEEQLEAAMNLAPPLCDIGLRYPQVADKLKLIANVPSCTFCFGHNAEQQIATAGKQQLVFAFNPQHATLSVSSAGVLSIKEFDSFIARLKIQLQSMATDGSRSLSTHPMLTDEDVDLLTQVNQTTQPHNPSTVDKLFSAMAKTAAERVAVKSSGRQLSYQELDEASSQFAKGLCASGVSRGDFVGVMMGRTCELLTVLMGVMKAGATFVPLDRNYPPNRLQYITGDCQLKLIVVDHAPNWSTDASQMIQYTSLMESGSDAADLPSVAQPDDLAYVIYTSGSTGLPKGVQVRHENVCNFFEGIDHRIGSEPGVLLATTTISFDISVLELLWTLTRGFAVILHDEETSRTQTQYPEQPLGFGLYFWNSTVSKDVEDSPYDLLLNAARYADKNGFDAVWTPERHFGSFGGHYPNPSVTGAAIAAITNNVQIRAGSCVLPLHHPVRVAEEWAVVDNLSGGRVGLSMAAGWNPDDFVLKPDGFATARDDLFVAIEQVRALWKGEAVSFPGPKGPVEVRTLPRPVQQSLPIWVTAAGNPDTFRRAGEIGANILTHLLGQTVDKLSGSIKVYRDAWKSAGHSGDGHVTVMVHTFVAETETEARNASREPMKAYLRTALALIKDAAWQFPTFKKFSAEGQRSVDEFFAEADPQEVDDLLEFAFERYFNNNSLLGSVDKCVEMTDALKQASVNEIGCLVDFGIDEKTVMAHLPFLSQVRNAANADDSQATSISQAILESGVTHLQCTPSRATMILHEGDAAAALGSLKSLMIGGEPMSRELAQQLCSATNAQIFNMYGPTETTIWSTVGNVRDAQDANNIGTPLANQTVHVIDPRNRALPPETTGELAIGGHGVTSGYLYKDELTAQSFTEITAADGSPTFAYKTGDQVRLRRDGQLEFIGRGDDQVKVRGYRIELGEIESCLQGHDDVSAAAVVVQRPNSPNAIITGFVVPANGSLSTDDLFAELKTQLPEFMVPSHLVSVPQLPYLANGKLDREQLAQFVVEAEARTDTVLPKTDTERALAEIWSELLNVRAISITDNFFDLGGHSLLAIQAIDAIQKKVNVRLNPRKILTNTLEQLAKDCAVATNTPEPKNEGGIFSRWFNRD